MAKQRFTFDDTKEYDSNELIPDNTIHVKTPDLDEVFEDKDGFNLDNQEPTVDNGEEVMKKEPKKKRKFEITKLKIIILVLVAIIVAFLLYIFLSSNNKGPVYGDRCASLLTLDDAKLDEAAKATGYETDDNIKSVKFTKDCRTIELTIEYAANIDVNTAKQHATDVLHVLDDSAGYEKPEGSSWTSLLGTAEGRGQYNVNIVLKSESDTAGFPIFGTKQPKKDAISFTDSLPVNQATTDRVTNPTPAQ